MVEWKAKKLSISKYHKDNPIRCIYHIRFTRLSNLDLSDNQMLTIEGIQRISMPSLFALNLSIFQCSIVDKNKLISIASLRKTKLSIKGMMICKLSKNRRWELVEWFQRMDEHTLEKYENAHNWEWIDELELAVSSSQSVG